MRRHLTWVAALILGTVMTAEQSTAAPHYEILAFDDLKGWAEDDHQAALKVFLETCPDIEDPDWASLCALATSQPNARTYFELFFRPVLINGDAPALFTGYYEPRFIACRLKLSPAPRGTPARRSKTRAFSKAAALRSPISTTRSTCSSCKCKAQAASPWKRAAQSVSATQAKTAATTAPSAKNLSAVASTSRIRSRRKSSKTGFAPTLSMAARFCTTTRPT